MVVLHALLSLINLGSNRERIEGFLEILYGHAVLGEQRADLTLILQTVALQVDSVEHRRVQHIQLTQRFSGVVHLRVDFHQIVPESRKPHNINIVRRVLFPGGQQGLKAKAVRAAIPERLKHLNFGSIPRIHRVGKLSIMRSSNIAFDLREAGKSHGQQADK